MFEQPSLSMRTGSPDEDSAANELDNYSLKWNNHSANFVQSFEEQFRHDSYVDVTLVCLDGIIKAHKIVLSTCSPFFARIFAEYESDEHAMVVLKDFSKEDLSIIASFMYRGEVFVNCENMASILAIAKNLEVKGLVRLINEHLARLNGPVTIGSPEPLNAASPTEAKEEHTSEITKMDRDGAINSSDGSSPLQLTTRDAHASPRDQQTASLPRPGTNHQHHHHHSSSENVAANLMPRRKQARPRRRSGEDGPQDLSSSKHVVNLEVGHLGLNHHQQSPQRSSPDQSRHRSSPIGQQHLSEDLEEEAENLSMNRDSGRSRSSSRSAQPTVKSEGEEPRSCPSTPRTAHQPHPSPSFEYPASGLQTSAAGVPLSPPMHHPNEYLNSINQLVSQWSPAQSQGHHHHHHHQQQQQHQHMSGVHPRHPSDAPAGQQQQQPPQPQQPRTAAQPYSASAGYPGASPPLVPLPAPYVDGLSQQPVFFHPGVPENFIQSLYAVGPQGQAQLQLATPQGAAQMVTPSMLSEQEQPISGTPNRRPKKSGRRRHSEGYARRWHAEQSELDAAGGGHARRAKGQHSAPRGGPPRCWTNYDLCNALRHVWGKKMTTSQASRTFSIPYNSLLMYVRGKYGKSLRLDELRDLIELENNNNVNLQRAQQHQQQHHHPHQQQQQINGKRSHARAGRAHAPSPPPAPSVQQQHQVGAPATTPTSVPPAAHPFYFPPEFANYHVPMMQHLIQQHQQQQQQADCELGRRSRRVSRSHSRSRSRSRPRSNGHLLPTSAPPARTSSTPSAQHSQHPQRPSSRSSNSSDRSPLALSLTRPHLLVQHQHQEGISAEEEQLLRRRICEQLD
ncbi:filaggrin-2 [Copidosoma floridanum]|uniref:filaggrin-2 n=1 Tax=Copidosoma floridanum TaxID=29053 RepID=UPI0006C9870B|nr:filaggrin-2 [Copidosoma floridanum]